MHQSIHCVNDDGSQPKRYEFQYSDAFLLVAIIISSINKYVTSSINKLFHFHAARPMSVMKTPLFPCVHRWSSVGSCVAFSGLNSTNSCPKPEFPSLWFRNCSSPRMKSCGELTAFRGFFESKHVTCDDKKNA